MSPGPQAQLANSQEAHDKPLGIRDCQGCRSVHDFGKDGIVGDHSRRSRPYELFSRSASTEISTRRRLFANANAKETVLDPVPDRQVSVPAEKLARWGFG